MLHIAENLKTLRKSKDMTQEDAAGLLSVSPQSVSKWERGDTYPDITLLPALANLYGTSVDALIGMDRINSEQTKHNFHAKAYDLTRDREYQAAIDLYHEALKHYPGDAEFLGGLALVLGLSGDPEKVKQAVELCERALAGHPGEKARHTIRAALCFIYWKAGEKDNALTAAKHLPHVRESREVILDEFNKDPTVEDIDTYLRFIIVGNSDG